MLVSVIITSHNYGHFLEPAILSVLAQTTRPHEILVVDDSSTDNTREVAERFADRGVTYLRLETGSVHKARRAGVQQTSGDVVLFLDADNCLAPDYIECGLKEFVSLKVGVVYADLQRFGQYDHDRTNFPPFTRGRLLRFNFVDACALIRRDALEVCSAWDTDLDEFLTPEDDWMFQCLARDGWEFRKQKGLVWYRTHDGQKNRRAYGDRKKAGYFILRGLHLQQVTLFIPLAGRDYAWAEQSRFLQRQSWPHDRIRLILCDTSQNAEFSQQIRQWIATCDYPDVRHFRFSAARPGIADESRYDRQTEHDVQIAMCRIYNRMRAAIDTDYVWVLEDDIIPPGDALERLMKHFGRDVACVGAPYLSRWDPKYVVWTADRKPGQKGVHRAVKPPAGESQLQPVRGMGFGCTVFRSEVLLDHIFRMPRGEPYYDPYFYRCLPETWKRFCDWSCEAEHVGPRGKGALSYWEGRKDLQYYRRAVEFARKHTPDAKSLLDVGGGVSLGCRYLEWFDWVPDRRSVERRDGDGTVDGITVEFADFAAWKSPHTFDVVLCLQVLEHQPDPATFARKLLQTGRVVIVSVPYRWPAGTCGDHRHDPVDEVKLREWFGCDPMEAKIRDTRLVAVYQGAAT